MRRFRNWIVLMVTGCLTGIAQAAPPPDFSATYSISRLGMKAGEMKVSLKRENGEIHYKADSRPQGVFNTFFKDQAYTEKARLEPRGDLLLPVEYEREQSKRDEHYRFDRKANTVEGEYRGKPDAGPVPADATDSFSLTLKLMRDAATRTESFSYPVVARGRLRTYEYQRLEPQTIDTPLGTLDTVVLERRKGDDDKTVYTVWFAPSLNYLPVRYVNSKDGSTQFTVELASVRWHGEDSGPAR